MQFKYVFMLVGLAVVTGTICYFWKQDYDKKDVLANAVKTVTADAKANRTINFLSA